MDKFLHILQNDFQEITIEDIYLPIKQTGIDSLDLVVIRVLLERYYNFVVSDVDWFSFNSLFEAHQYFQKLGISKTDCISLKPKELSINDAVEVRMPQMSNNTLSESWLFKYLGDLHWQLLTKAFDTKSSKFINDKGNRLYAAFVRVCIELSPLNSFVENDIIDVVSEIKSFGNDTFLSTVIASSNQNIINCDLMTIFSERKDEKSNNTILKSVPNIKHKLKSEYSHTPIFLNDYRLLRKGLLDELLSKKWKFKITDKILFTCNYEINPYYDINGVGLLYFAAYPIISDNSLIKFKPYLIEYQTVFRDVFYFSNCNLNDKVIFRLNSLIENKNEMKIATTLLRSSDNEILAKIFTVKIMNDK